MSVEVDYCYSDELFHADEVANWYWPIGYPTDGRYWGLAVVPEHANVAVCQLLDNWWATDNSDQFHLTAFSMSRASRAASFSG